MQTDGTSTLATLLPTRFAHEGSGREHGGDIRVLLVENGRSPHLKLEGQSVRLLGLCTVASICAPEWLEQHAVEPQVSPVAKHR